MTKKTFASSTPNKKRQESPAAKTATVQSLKYADMVKGTTGIISYRNAAATTV